MGCHTILPFACRQGRVHLDFPDPAQARFAFGDDGVVSNKVIIE